MINLWISFWRGRLFHQTWHPSFDELVLYLDGELGPNRDRVGNHTKNCWSCRLRLQKIDRAISEFMEARNASFHGPNALPAHVLPNFAARLDRLESECGGRASFFSDLRLPRFSPRLAIFAASLVLLTMIFVQVTQPVSAKEVLTQIKRAEERRLREAQTPVIYEKLELRRTSRKKIETATWEIWNDTGSHRLRQRREDHAAPLDDFQRVARNHGGDPARPLSTANYEAWRRAILGQSEEVLEKRLPNGDRTATLKVSGRGPFAPDAIVGAELTVRMTDWHPIAERLVVQQQDEVVDYSVGEVAYDLLALNSIPASIFADVAPSAAPAPRVTLPRTAPPPAILDLWPVSGDPLPSAADLTAAEVEAFYALHSVHACTGRPLAVQMLVDRIAITGLVDTEERKAEVLLALRGIPYVSADIRSLDSPSEIPPEIQVQSPALLESVSPSTPAAKPKLAAEDLLRRYFAASKCAGMEGTCVQDAVADLSREALAHSEEAHAQAWALRRLVEWQPFQNRDALRTSTRRLLELMVRDHMDALHNELTQARIRLQPVLASLPPERSPVAGEPVIMPGDGESDWVTPALLRLCNAVEETVNLTLGEFAETNRPADHPEQGIRELLSRLDALHDQYPKLEAEVVAHLSGFPKPLASAETSELK